MSRHIDCTELRNVLNSLSCSQSVPYLERRPLRKNADPVQELAWAIQELTAKERDLKTAVGIALNLVDSIETLEESLHSSQSRTRSLLRLEAVYEEEMFSLKESLDQTQDELKLAKDALAASQLKVTALDESLSIYTSECNDESLLETEIKDLNERINKFRFKNNLQKTRICELVNENERLATTLGLAKTEKEKIAARLVHLQESLERAQSAIHAKHTKYQTAKAETQTLASQLAKVERELKVFKLMEKLDEVSEEETGSEEPGLSLKGEFNRLELGPLSTNTLESVGIKGKIHRKSPQEEFFNLVRNIQTSQAVKINSPYMDSICGVSTNELYTKAMAEKVPFHKWAVWVENELNRAYLQMVCQPLSHPKPKFFRMFSLGSL